MDDWFSVLLFLIFIVLPLLEAMFGKRKKKPRPQPRPRREEWEWEPDREPTRIEIPLPAPREPAPSGGSGDWSAGWGAWPGASAEAEAESLEREVEEPASAEGESLERIVIEPVPDRSEPATRVVSMEPLEIDRAKQHRRFHERYVTPVPAPPAVSVARRRRSPAIAPLLRESGDIRRAIVLAEVLGPPRALRRPGHEPGGGG